MGTISSSVGLVSGMDIQSLVKQLMSIESRPLTQLQQRIEATKKQQLAYTELTARLIAAEGAVKRLAQASAFNVRKATSSNPDVLTATADEKTPLSTFAFQVRSMVSTHQLVTGGLADRDRTPVGAGSLTFEVGNARVDKSTALAALDGGQGVRRGMIRIVDRMGGSADVDLTAAVTIDDVIEAINSQTTANVRASIDGDRLVVTDRTGAAAGSLRIQDIGGGFAATDLGLVGASDTGQILGRDLMQLTAGTRLASLNDGLGVRTAGNADDLQFTLKDGRQVTVNLSSNLRFDTKLAELNDGRGVRLDGTIRLTNRQGASAEISLAGATTVQDVVTAISNSGLSLSASLSGSKLVISDTSGGTGSNLKIEDVNGSAAADLGIVANVAAASVAGAGVFRVDTAGAVVRAIQYAEGNNGALTASLVDNRLVLKDTTIGPGTTSVQALNGSLALRDLGLQGGFAGDTLNGRNLVAGLNTVLLSSLKGGAGIGTGVVSFTRRDGSTLQVDFAGAQTLSDITDRLNRAGLTAAVNTGGTGIDITDSTVGAGTLAATDVSGTTAADLGLTSAGADRLASGDLQLQYISENTLLSDLNAGKGIKYGTFKITAANGVSTDVSLVNTAHKTVGDVIRAVNSLNINVQARINATGDGIEFVDNTGGTGSLSIAEKGSGTTAADLGILGMARSGSNVVTGSFSKSVTITGSDTLDQVVEKINAANAGVTARVLNDGNPYAPYRLTITSNTSGTKGEIAYRMEGTGLSMRTLSEAQDAVVVVGDGRSPNPIVVTSSSNNVTGIVDGLTLNLTGTSRQPVQVKVEQDVEQVVTDIKTFVKTFNDAVDRIQDLTKFVPETNEKGILLGDHTVLRVRDQLYSAVTQSARLDGATLRTLGQVGLTVGQGARLQFDETRFRERYEQDPAAVRQLFTAVGKDAQGKALSQGVAARLRDTLDEITRVTDGTIALQADSLKDRIDLYDRRATEMQLLLDKKEARLYAQFQAMERSLAQLQTQQTALAGLSGQAAAMSSFSFG